MDIARINADNPVSATAAQQAAQPASPETVTQQRELIKAVKAVNASELFGDNSELTFVMDRQSRRALVRIVDRKTREVKLQIPPEYVIRMAEEMKRR